MNIKIIATGKIKEQYLKDAIKEYTKRLTTYCSFEIIEIPAENILDETMSLMTYQEFLSYGVVVALKTRTK